MYVCLNVLCYWTVIFNVDAFNFGHVNFDQSTVVRNQHACCAIVFFNFLNIATRNIAQHHTLMEHFHLLGFILWIPRISMGGGQQISRGDSRIGGTP